MAETDLETFLHKTHIRPSRVLAAWPTMISFYVFVSTNIEIMVLKGLIQVMLDFQLDTAIVIQLPIILAFKVGPGSSEKFWFGVAMLSSSA